MTARIIPAPDLLILPAQLGTWKINLPIDMASSDGLNIIKTRYKVKVGIVLFSQLKTSSHIRTL